MLLFLFQSCIKYDGNIKKEYRNQINHYQSGQIIVYTDGLSKRDSVRVIGVDSSATSHGPSNLPFKNVFLMIEHIPNNYWNDGIVLRKSTKKFDSVAKQKLLSIIKTQKSNNENDDEYAFPVEYRDFFGTLNFKSLNKKKVDTIRCILKNKRLSDSSVIEVYWHIDKGMIGYKKNNGSNYNLITE